MEVCNLKYGLLVMVGVSQCVCVCVCVCVCFCPNEIVEVGKF
jgi:hypothetical protein